MAPAVLPPLALAPIPVPRPWGGSRAHALLGLGAQKGGTPAADPFRAEPIGEWWLLSARAEKPSRVIGGPHDGAPLPELLAAEGPRLLGRRHAEAWRRRFPLLLKLLDTATALSIQVHPSDADLPGEGKTETWYVLSAESGACFWLGLNPGRAPDEVIERARRRESPESLLVRHAARPGALAHLPPGTIHALGPGLVVVEFQTNADTTIRIWDWGRTPERPLHLDQARRVARLEQRPELPTPTSCGGPPPCDRLVACDAYRVERMRLASPSHLATDGERFEVLLALGAATRVAGPHGAAEVPRGHAALVPAETTDYVVTPQGEVELLRLLPEPPRAAATKGPR